MAGIRGEILAVREWLREIRRDFHRHPEPGYQEIRTSGIIKSILEDLGLSVRTRVGGTGVVALWQAPNPGPTVGLRADMDALPVEECANQPWKSVHAGWMHACGHDLHMAMVLGTARILAQGKNTQRLKGSVKFIFQPAEEGGAGAGAMIADGVLKDPPLAAIFSAHVVPVLPVGRISYTQGVAMAAVDNFSVTIRGRGGHAAHPELAADPILPAARMVAYLKARTADLDGALLAVCTLSAGTQTNIIPDRAAFSGTIRSLRVAGREEAIKALKDTARLIEQETGRAVTVRLESGYPMLQNDPDMLDRAVRVASEALGPENVGRQGPSYGAEDMAFFLEKVPGAYFWLGCGRSGETDPAMLHSPEFDPDEGVLDVGVEVFSRIIEDFLG